MKRISIRPSHKNELLYTICQASHTNKEKREKDLPIWYDKKNIVQYHLPPQLQCLWEESEKHLIYHVSAYVPLLHLKDGQIGSRGHVCSFVQNVESICNDLPRLPDDVQFVKGVIKYLQEGGVTVSKTFT